MAASKTPVFDWETGEFKTDSQGRVIIAENAQALEQVAIKASTTPRGVYLIYANPDNLDLDHKYGSDVLTILLHEDLTHEERESEVKRAIKEALVYDTWITDVTDITLEYVVIDSATQVIASYSLTTVFDDVYIEGVVLNG